LRGSGSNPGGFFGSSGFASKKAALRRPFLLAEAEGFELAV
jgi:hypothetical protein